MEMSSKPRSVLFEAENYDDDAFYAEIRRQILLLTSEDNEELIETKSFNTVSVANGGGSNRPSYGFNKGVSPPASSFCSWETESSGSPPDWLVNLWKHGKGTGVFIPQVACKKNHRSGRVNNGSRRIYRQVVNKD